MTSLGSSQAKGLRFAALVLCFALAAIAGAAPAHSAPETGLRLDPTTTRMTTGETLALTLWVDDVENLHRVELHVDYDWPSLEVQDADAEQVSVQIEPGPIFCSTCILWNEAHAGHINFVAQRDHDGPFSGSGAAAYITVTMAATEPGSYTVSFDQTATRILDNGGSPIKVGRFTSATIVLSEPQARLTGWLTREGWNSYARSAVNAVLYPAAPPYEPLTWGRACSDDHGDLALELAERLQPPPEEILPSDVPPPSTGCTSRWAFVHFDFTNYLDECYWKCADGATSDIGWHDLEGGDVDANGCVNILDIVKIIGGFGETVEAPCYVPCTECAPAPPLPNAAPQYDINGDCKINILDLTQAAGNFGLCSNCH